MDLPYSLKSILDGRTGTENNVGLSGSRVIVYDDCVLKIEDHTKSVADTIAVMRWLDGKIPVPQVIHQEFTNGKSYLLMSKASGVMSCNDRYLSDPEVLSEGLAQGLHMFWDVDITGCPKTRSLKLMLSEARQRVENNDLDYDLMDSNTFGPNGFKDPEQLLCWLEANRPEEEWALCHGDYSLPNVFLNNGNVSCFIDLGDTAVSDKWRDIALCYRSLDRNYRGCYGGKVYPDSDPKLLFEKLGVKPDWERVRYHILLDELF